MSKKTEDKAAVTNEKSVTKSAEKKVSKADKKTLGFKKLPGIFKKSYTDKKFEKKILKRVYIPQDRELISSLFVKGADSKKPECLAVSRDAKFSKKEIKKLKLVAKDIKANGGRFKIAPFIAVLALLAAIVIVIAVFKNPLAKKVLKAGCEGAFGARTDIEYVDVSFLSTSITVKNIAVGNKNSEYRNLFEAEKIQLDFNLIQALRGKFVAQNLEASGMEFNTERTTSCALPEKEKKQEEKEEKESVFVTSLNKEKDAAVEKIQYEITNVLGGTDVDSIVANVQSNLKSPEKARETVEQAKAMSEKWQAKPAEIEKDVSDFYSSAKALSEINVKEIKDAATLKADLEKLQKAVETGNKLKGETESVVSEVKTDYEAVSKMASDVKASVDSDIAYAKNTLTSVAGLGKSALEILTSGIDSLGYDVMGKFYPYAKKAFNFAMSIKEGQYDQEIDKAEDFASKVKVAKQVTAKNKKQKKSEGKKRMEGITFWYVSDCPSFLIERAYASGTGFEAEVKEITNDPNIRNIPLTAKGSFVLGDVKHSADITMDARKETSAPLFTVSYTGSGFNADFKGETVAVKCGVPSLSGKTVISLNGTAGSDGFTAGGKVSVNPASLSSDGFENEMLTKYYSQALDAVDSLNFGYNASFSETEGVGLSLSGNFGDQFVKALSKAAASVGSDAKNAALAKLQESLNSSNSEVVSTVKEFAGIKGDIDLQNAKLDEIQKSLNAKIKEIQDQLTAQAKQQATDAAKSAVNGVLGNFGF